MNPPLCGFFALKKRRPDFTQEGFIFDSGGAKTKKGHPKAAFE
jgi:hypothetical protein